MGWKVSKKNSGQKAKEDKTVQVNGKTVGMDYMGLCPLREQQTVLCVGKADLAAEEAGEKGRRQILMG